MENVKENAGEKNIVKDTKEKIVVANDGLNFFERILELNRRYSLWEVVKSLFVMAFVIWFGVLMLNPTILFDRYDKINKEKHAYELKHRFDKSKEISTELQLLMNKLHADRTFFIEYHNSVKSLEGAPFAYGSMDFEETNDGVDFIGDEYTNFSLTKYKFVNYLSENLLFVGDISEMENIDKRLYLKLVSNEIKQVAFIEVEGTENPLGILGVTWSKHDVMATHKDAIKKEMRANAVKLAFILNKKTNTNETTK